MDMVSVCESSILNSKLIRPEIPPKVCGKSRAANRPLQEFTDFSHRLEKKVTSTPQNLPPKMAQKKNRTVPSPPRRRNGVFFFWAAFLLLLFLGSMSNTGRGRKEGGGRG